MRNVDHDQRALDLRRPLSDRHARRPPIRRSTSAGDKPAAGLPEIAVSPNARQAAASSRQDASGRRTILEIGTLGRVQHDLARARVAAGGHLITLEADPRHADIARANIGTAGLSRVVQVRVGAALDTLPQLAAEGRGPFDLVFIDADKVNTAPYFTLGARPCSAGHHHRRRQRGAGRRGGGRVEHRSVRAGDAPVLPARSVGTARGCDRDSDRRDQGLRRAGDRASDRCGRVMA